jgi:hypothetical protein
MATGRTKFIAAIGAAFPTLSNTMLMKCWQDVHRLPEAALDHLYNGLVQGGIAAIEARAAQAIAITQSIGAEVRR